MSTSETGLTASWVQSITDFSRDEWDRLALPRTSPFLEWDWLRLVEDSGSASPENGWIPFHLSVRKNSRLVAAAPLYLKLHSQGEFVFDHMWVEVARKLGLSYYPKLVGMSPFTPTGNYRFLIHERESEPEISASMIRLIDRFCAEQKLGGSSFHYVDPAWGKSMEEHGYRSWLHPSFAWYNQGYSTFDDFLVRFNANQRRNIRKERQSLEKQGIALTTLSGHQAPDSFYSFMHELYVRHNEQFGPWSCRYLTPRFFEDLKNAFGRRILFIAASLAGSPQAPFAMAMLVHKGGQLYGRYWGTTREVKNLHFNVCYYEPIAWAIEHNIQRFDPGIGGMHKSRRGFVAEPNYSLHRFQDPIMRTVMDQHMQMINSLEWGEIEELNKTIPFKQPG